MKRRDFLKAGLGAAVAGSLALERGASADTNDRDGLKLRDCVERSFWC